MCVTDPILKIKTSYVVGTCGYVKGRQQQHIKYFVVIPNDVDPSFFNRFIISQRCTKENDSFPRQLPDIEVILRLLAASLTCWMSASLKSLFSLTRWTSVSGVPIYG